MKHKGGTREDRIQARLNKMVMRIVRLEEENKELKQKLEGVHEQYAPVINWMHRMYCLPSQADEIMKWILADLEKIEEGRNAFYDV